MFRIYVVSVDGLGVCCMAVSAFSVGVGVGVETMGDAVTFDVFTGFAAPDEHEDSSTAADNNSMISFVFVFKACMVEISL